MVRYVVAWPSKSVRKILDHNSSAIFLDDGGWSVYSGIKQKRELVCLQPNMKNKTSKVNIPDIRSRVNWWAPIWTRWLGACENYELERAHAVSNIYRLISELTALRVKYVLFQTGVPHHYETVLLSIACEILELPQIYLYANVFNNQLLPFIQQNDIFSRKKIGIKFCDYDYTDIINSFFQNKINNNLPKTNTKLSGWKKNIWLARLYIFYMVGKRVINKNIFIKEKISKKFLIEADYSIFGFLRIVKNQKIFIKSYCIHQLNYDQINKLKNDFTPRLLIAAHYQPEATSFPEGGDYFNHVDIVLALRQKGYKNNILYKEHPASWLYLDKIIGLTRVGTWRSGQYINDLLELDCSFLPSDFPLEVEYEKSKWYLPVTISGTIAIERSLAGLHTIVTGVPWYKGLPGCLMLSDIESLEDINESWVKPNIDIAKSARDFLNDLLSCGTLINTIGIGTGKPDLDPSSESEFINQFKKLINGIDEKLH
jgi:hypothetical protein